MSEKFINSLFGLPSTKKLSDSGIPQTSNNTLEDNHEDNSFLTKLSSEMESSATLDDQSYTPVPSELNNNITDSDDINQIIELLSMGLQTNLTDNTDDSQLQLNQELKPLSESNTVPLKITHETAVPFSEKSNTNQGMINIVQSLTGKLNTEQPATSFPEKLNSTNITKELTKDSISEQPLTPLLDKLSINQNNTKTNEQKTTTIIQNSASLAKAVVNGTDQGPVSQSPNIAGRQILESHKESSANTLSVRLNSNKDFGRIQSTAPVGNISNTEQNTVNNGSSNNSLSSIEKEITRPNANIHDLRKTQLTEKTPFTKVSINQPDQQGSAQINADNNDSPVIVNAGLNSTEAKATKSFENTTITNNNGANLVETTIPVNTSSDNSFSNNQGADTPYEFQVNPINVKQNTEPEKNFTNTLSLISGSNKPPESLGNDVADNIIQNAKLYMQGGKSEIKMQLNPPELGTLKLEFAYEDDILETKITVERSAVKDAIEKDIPRLKEFISNSDIDIGKLDVSLQERENGHLGFMNKDYQSDSKSSNAQEFPNQENEYREDDSDEETMVNNTESTQINYLV